MGDAPAVGRFERGAPAEEALELDARAPQPLAVTRLGLGGREEGLPRRLERRVAAVDVEQRGRRRVAQLEVRVAQQGLQPDRAALGGDAAQDLADAAPHRQRRAHAQHHVEQGAPRAPGRRVAGPRRSRARARSSRAGGWRAGPAPASASCGVAAWRRRAGRRPSAGRRSRAAPRRARRARRGFARSRRRERAARRTPPRAARHDAPADAPAARRARARRPRPRRSRYPCLRAPTSAPSPPSSPTRSAAWWRRGRAGRAGLRCRGAGSRPATRRSPGAGAASRSSQRHPRRRRCRAGSAPPASERSRSRRRRRRRPPPCPACRHPRPPGSSSRRFFSGGSGRVEQLVARAVERALDHAASPAAHARSRRPGRERSSASEAQPDARCGLRPHRRARARASASERPRQEVLHGRSVAEAQSRDRRARRRTRAPPGRREVRPLHVALNT